MGSASTPYVYKIKPGSDAGSLRRQRPGLGTFFRAGRGHSVELHADAGAGVTPVSAIPR